MTSSSCTATPPMPSAWTATQRYELSWVRQKFEADGQHAPDCACGGYIKTATVSFGQAMPAEAMQRAEELTASCDLFLAIGSSLVVWPAAGFPLMAKRNGAALVIINREPTEFDEIADLVVRDDIGDVLGALHRALIRKRVALCTDAVRKHILHFAARGRCYLEIHRFVEALRKRRQKSGGVRRHGVGRD